MSYWESEGSIIVTGNNKPPDKADHKADRSRLTVPMQQPDQDIVIGISSAANTRLS